jgi:hypothetical protein
LTEGHALKFVKFLTKRTEVDLLNSNTKVMKLSPKTKDKKFSSAGNALAITVKASPKLLPDLESFINISGSFVRKELVDMAGLSDSQHDAMLIDIMDLIMSVMKMAIMDDSSKSTLSSCDLLNKKESWQSLLLPMLKSQSGSTQSSDSTASRNLIYKIRVIFDVPKEQHDLALTEARRNGNEKVFLNH